MNKFFVACLLLATPLLAAAQDAAAVPADPATVVIKPVLRPSFKRNPQGEYDVPGSATTDYGAALAGALAKWAGVKDDAVTVAPGTPVIASKPGSKVVQDGVTCAGPNVCMPFDASIKAASEKAANKLRDSLSTGNLDGLQNEIKKAIAGATGADGAALAAARGFNVGSVDGKPVSRSLDFASLANTSGGKGGGGGLSKGAIAGIVIGSILGALLLAGLLWALCCRGARASSGAAATTTAAHTAHDAKLGAPAAATTAAGAAGAPRPATTTAATDAKLGGVGAVSGGNRAVAGTTAAAPTAATTTTTAATAVEPEKQPSGLAKLASTLSGRRSKGAEVIDKAVDKAADAVKDAAQGV